MSLYWKFRMGLLLVGLATAIVGFAGPWSDDAAAAALPKDPCALLKSAEIQALAANATIGNGVPATDTLPLAVSCGYAWGTRSNEWGQTSLSVIVTDASKVWPAGLSPDDIKQRVDLEAKEGGPDASEIPGIGDGAVFTTNPKSHDAMAKAYVIKGKGILLLVTFHGGNAPSLKDKIIALLKDAAGRL